ncbi:MAG: hypothetical protein O2923_02155 [Verrucomicrobia bacterium]|nr:hypothetical protein [Verrucomicrobiota bacterium]MDA1085964.1 hypothetical protein [Verrucomicrobiota bacterium]
MKTAVTLSMIGLCALLTAGDVAAASDEVLPGMGHRLVRGTANTVTGVVELPMQICKGYKSGVGAIKNPLLSKTVGTVLGFFRGIRHAAGRTTYGAVEVVTFWSANPESNEGVGIPLDAEYAWEEGERYSVKKPSLKEGLMPYPRKIIRGVSNGFLGVLEVPGQIYRGVCDDGLIGAPIGLVKGLWFGVGRSIYGLGDAALFLLPNPKEQVGYAFEQEYPWGAITE